MRNSLIRLAIVALCVFLASCGYDARVVLVPDPDGHVGRIEVSNAAGSQTLDQARTGSSVKRGEAPQPPKAVSPEDIEKTWGETLAALPPPPRTFLLYFESGTATLTADSRGSLTEIAAAARARPFPRLQVAGHADATGSDEVNIRVSRERAEAVRNLLVEGGVAAASIQVASHGKRNPLIRTPDGIAEPRNRRVSVVVQ